MATTLTKPQVTATQQYAVGQHVVGVLIAMMLRCDKYGLAFHDLLDEAERGLLLIVDPPEARHAGEGSPGEGAQD